MKRGKEIKINVVNNLNVKFGTVDNKNPKSIYITISGWGEPCYDEDIDYSKVIKNTHKQLKQQIYNHGDSDFFNLNKTIIDFNMRQSGVGYGKRSYMCCEINLYQNNSYDISSSVLYDALKKVLDVVVLDNLNNHEFFKFYKTKT